MEFIVIVGAVHIASTHVVYARIYNITCTFLFLKYDLQHLKMCSQFNRCSRKEQKLKHERRWSNLLLSLSLSLRKLGNWRCELCHFTKEIVHNVYRSALALPMADIDAIGARSFVARAFVCPCSEAKNGKRLLLPNVLKIISIFVHRLPYALCSAIFHSRHCLLSFGKRHDKVKGSTASGWTRAFTTNELNENERDEKEKKTTTAYVAGSYLWRANFVRPLRRQWKKKNANKNRSVRCTSRRPTSIFVFAVISGIVFSFSTIRRFNFNFILFHFTYLLMSCRNVAQYFVFFCSFCLCRLSLFASISFCQSSCTIIALLFITMIQTYTKLFTFISLARSIYIIFFFPNGYLVLISFPPFARHILFEALLFIISLCLIRLRSPLWKRKVTWPLNNVQM